MNLNMQYINDMKNVTGDDVANVMTWHNDMAR